eukprot:scaffold16852_cov35-Attheya_sp.AAC.1
MTQRLCERIHVGVRACESSTFGTDYFLRGQFLYSYMYIFNTGTRDRLARSALPRDECTIMVDYL